MNLYVVSIGEVSLGNKLDIMEVENGYLQVHFSVGSFSVKNDEKR